MVKAFAANGGIMVAIILNKKIFLTRCKIYNLY